MKFKKILLLLLLIVTSIAIIIPQFIAAMEPGKCKGHGTCLPTEEVKQYACTTTLCGRDEGNENNCNICVPIGP